MPNVPGLLRKSVDRPFAEVLAAAEAAIVDAGAEVIAKIDHADAAAKAGLHLRPTTVLLFGNPAGGTLLMQALCEVAIDLPMRLLIVAGDDGKVRIMGEDPVGIVERHGSAAGLETVVAGMRRVMQHVLDVTASASPTAAS